MTITITKSFSFEMGHFLRDHSGLCKFPHGHSYTLEVTIAGSVHDPLRDFNGLLDTKVSSEGMVMDFYDLKSWVKPFIDQLDHSFMTGPEGIEFQESNPAASGSESLEYMQSRVRVMPWRPTTENLAKYLFEHIAKTLPNDVVLSQIRLYETKTGWVTVTP